MMGTLDLDREFEHFLSTNRSAIISAREKIMASSDNVEELFHKLKSSPVVMQISKRISTSRMAFDEFERKVKESLDSIPIVGDVLVIIGGCIFASASGDLVLLGVSVILMCWGAYEIFGNRSEFLRRKMSELKKMIFSIN